MRNWRKDKKYKMKKIRGGRQMRRREKCLDVCAHVCVCVCGGGGGERERERELELKGGWGGLRIREEDGECIMVQK